MNKAHEAKVIQKHRAESKSSKKRRVEQISLDPSAIYRHSENITQENNNGPIRLPRESNQLGNTGKKVKRPPWPRSNNGLGRQSWSTFAKSQTKKKSLNHRRLTSTDQTAEGGGDAFLVHHAQEQEV
jgi:hypothetical protein